MSVVIDSRIGDENMLYPSPENDALNDSKVSKDSNALMEDQMSASNDHLEEGPQQPQHIFVLDRQSSLGKRELDSVFDRLSSGSSVVSLTDDAAAISPKRQKQVYGKKKQKLSARQRKRQLERNFGSDFKPGTIRHRLNFLQHSFGDQLALIEESLPKTFFRNMNLETFIKNKMEQHEQHVHGDVSRSPSFRRSPERRIKLSIKDGSHETKQGQQSKKDQQQKPEMAEIMTFAPQETPHFEATAAAASSGQPRENIPLSSGSFPLDRSAREWRLSKFLEESPPPSPSPVKEVREESVVASHETSDLPQVPILDALDTPAVPPTPITTTSDVPVEKEEQDAAVAPPSEAPTVAPLEEKEVPSAPAAPSTEEKEVPTASTEEKEVPATPVASSEEKEVPATAVALTPTHAPADVARISATGIVEDVVTTPEKEKPIETPAPVVEEAPAASEEQAPTAIEESPAPVAAAPVEDEAAATAEPTAEAATDVTTEPSKEEASTTTTEPTAVEQAAVPPVETPPPAIEAAEVAGDEIESDDDTMGSSASSIFSQPEGVVEAPVEPEPEKTPTGRGVVEPSAEPAPTTAQVAATEQQAQKEDEPVSVQVKESASKIPDVGEDAPSRGESPQVQTKKAVEVAPEEPKKEAPVTTPEEPKPEAPQDEAVSEPEPMAVGTSKSAPQDAAAEAAAPTTPVASEAVAEEKSMAIDTNAAPTEDAPVLSTPVAGASAASFESPRPLDAVERARMEQATPIKVESSDAAPAKSTPDAVEQARMEQQTPVKTKTEESAAAPEDTPAAAKETKPEASDASASAETTATTDENKDIQNCPSPSSVMDSELGDKENQKVKKQVPLKENRKIRFADEAGQELTKEYVIEREANYASRIVVMLLSPRDRKFEFLHAEYPLDESTTVQVLLEQVPLLATNDAFRTKKFNALLQTETSRQLDNNLALQDYCFKESEIVLGIPDDFTVANMTKMAVPLLLNKKLMKTVKQAIRKGRGLKTVQSGVEWRK